MNSANVSQNVRIEWHAKNNTAKFQLIADKYTHS